MPAPIVVDDGHDVDEEEEEADPAAGAEVARPTGGGGKGDSAAEGGKEGGCRLLLVLRRGVGAQAARCCLQRWSRQAGEGWWSIVAASVLRVLFWLDGKVAVLLCAAAGKRCVLHPLALWVGQ